MEYPTDPFTVLRAALLQLAEDALYMETEHENGPARPCPDYTAELHATIAALLAAESLPELAAVQWVSGKAALNLF